MIMWIKSACNCLTSCKKRLVVHDNRIISSVLCSLAQRNRINTMVFRINKMPTLISLLIFIFLLRVFFRSVLLGWPFLQIQQSNAHSANEFYNKNIICLFDVLKTQTKCKQWTFFSLYCVCDWHWFSANFPLAYLWCAISKSPRVLFNW